MERKVDPDLLSLGGNIAKIRNKKGFSQDDLANEAEIGRRTMTRLESGRSDIRFLTLAKIAKTLNVKVKDLVDF